MLAAQNRSRDDRRMTAEAPAENAVWRSVLLGFLAGAGTFATFVVVVFALSAVAAAPLLILIAMGFGGMSKTLLILLAALVVALVTPFAALWLWRRITGGGFFRQQRGALGWVAVAAGALAGGAACLALIPEFTRNTLVELVTGERPGARAPLPATDAERERLAQRVRPAALAGDPAAQVELGLALHYAAGGETRDLDEAAVWIKKAAAHPQGYEGRLLVAVNRMAEPVPRSGRIVTDEDFAVKIAALRRLAPDLPPDWQPVLLGIAGAMPCPWSHHGCGDHSGRNALAEAGRAGSRAYTVHAAELEEAAATKDERNGRLEQAAAGWRRAQQGYATAGAFYEVARLRYETLPERLEGFPDPPPVAAWPAPDAELAQRFWRFAWALDAEYVHERAPHAHQEVAGAMALLAMERAPDPAAIASLDPARRWTRNPRAVGRFLLALRHARGDCSAALELSNSIRRRPGTGLPNDTLRVSMHDMAWALAWAEVAERCAVTDELRQDAGYSRRSLVAMYVDASDLESARAGVAATVAALR